MKERQIEIADNLRHLGGCFDDYAELQEMAKQRASELVSTLGLNPNEFCEISFWTNGVPELICITRFECDANGDVSYVCDDSQSTL